MKQIFFSRRTVWTGILLCWLSSLSSCVLSSELVTLRTDLNRMELQLQQIQKGLQILEDRSRETLQKTASTLTRDIDLSRQNQADLRTTVEELQQMVRVLGEQINGHQTRFSQLSTKLDELQREILQRLDVLGRESGGSGEKSPTGAPPMAAPTATISPREVYNVAYEDYLKGRFKLAIQGFQSYVVQFPHTELAADAQYWLAESYYSTHDFPRAVAEFQQLLRLYPQSPKIPSGLLKMGYAYYEMGRPEQGEQELQRLIQKFPFSAEAKLAEQRIKKGQGG